MGLAAVPGLVEGPFGVPRGLVVLLPIGLPGRHLVPDPGGRVGEPFHRMPVMTMTWSLSSLSEIFMFLLLRLPPPAGCAEDSGLAARIGQPGPGLDPLSSDAR
jgi:hypothetical protein